MRDTVEIIDAEDVPLAYYPGHTNRVKVKSRGRPGVASGLQESRLAERGRQRDGRASFPSRSVGVRLCYHTTR